MATETGARVEDIKSKISSEAMAPTHEDTIRAFGEKVLSEPIPWEGYCNAGLIQTNELNLIKKYDKCSREARVQLFQKESDVYAQLFMELLVKLNKEITLQYLLTLMDQLFTDLPDAPIPFLELTAKFPAYPFEPLGKLLNRPQNTSPNEWYTYAKASQIAGEFLFRAYNFPEDAVRSMVNWAREQLTHSDDRDIYICVSVLAKVLKRSVYRIHFGTHEILQSLGAVLRLKMKSVQMAYRVILTIWILSYDKDVAIEFGHTKVIPVLVEILKVVAQEKVIRVACASLRNALNLGENNKLMVECGAMKYIEIISNRVLSDADLKDDIEVLKQALTLGVEDLTTFDYYKGEILSGELDWSSPSHRSEKFWKENIVKFEEDNYGLLKQLKDILNSSKDPQNIAIACFDLGEFARFHPRGKLILQQLGIKIMLMTLMEDKDTEIRKQALVAVQKMMVSNWTSNSVMFA